MGRYDGKNVVITGGSSGFGLETAKLLADGGARVLITGRTQQRLDAAREQIGDGAVAVRGDVSSLAEVESLAERVRGELGSVHAFFANAGVARFAPFAGTSEEVFDEIMTINAKGVYFTAQQLAPLMPAGSGIVLTTSVANVLGIPMISAYAASKAAVRSMARSLARELLPQGIRVNAVSPGPIETGVLDRELPAEAASQARSQMTDENPMKRFGDPAEVAAAVAFLAFDATYTTGAELPVDGGGSQI